MPVHGDISDVECFKTSNELIDYVFEQGNKDNLHADTFDVDSFKKEIHFYHNVYRSKHGVPDVTVDSSIERLAQKYSEVMSTRRNMLVHDTNKKYGENIYFYEANHLPKPETLAKLVMHDFYIEGIGYDYKTLVPNGYKKTGHFTQIIWESARKIGVGVCIKEFAAKDAIYGKSTLPSYNVQVCIKYDPPGNISSLMYYLENVRPPVRA